MAVHGCTLPACRAAAAAAGLGCKEMERPGERGGDSLEE